VQKAKSYQDEGYGIVVDMDLSKFFDEVPHKRLMSRIMIKTAGEWEIHRLINQYLVTGMLDGGLVPQRVKGVPQGSPLSPLLSNIVLDELDKEIEKRGLKHVRYADDSNIYVKTKRSGERVYNSITDFVERKMKLKVNKEKSKVDRPVKRKFLGFSFYYKKGCMGIRVAAKSISRLKDKVRELSKRGRGMNLEIFIHEHLNPCLRGWFNYYKIADMLTLCKDLDQWIRHRLRNIMWRQWKRNWTRFTNMRKAGLSSPEAAKAAFSQRGPWHTARSLSMNTAFPIAYFDDLGLFNFTVKYQTLKTINK
jgi:RNA-directed DNA polymerase